jgi:hypothetical protein
MLKDEVLGNRRVECEEKRGWGKAKGGKTTPLYIKNPHLTGRYPEP